MCRRVGTVRWLIAATGALFLAAPVGAETAKLELKRLEARAQFVLGTDFFVRASQPQAHFTQLGLKGRQLGTQEFAKLIRKEPKYEAAEPIRGVFQLGGQKFCFALDAVPSKQPEERPKDKAPGQDAKPDDPQPGKSTAGAAPTVTPYNRLYFDCNHNGDLTDDPPVDGKPPAIPGYPPQYALVVFPAVEVKLQVEGSDYAYAFFVQSTSYASAEFRYVQVSLEPAVYRHGTITLDGRPREVYLTDFNSNGRFDDVPEVTTVKLSGGESRLMIQYGDMLMFGSPPSLLSPGVSPFDVTTTEGRHLVSKLLCLDQKFYEVKVSSSGDTLTLTATKLPMGRLRSPHPRFQALLHGDLGVVKVVGSENEIPMPAGQWRLASYTLDLTAQREKALAAARAGEKQAGKPAPTKEGKPPSEKKAAKTAEGSVLSLLARSLVGAAVPQSPLRRGGPTIVSATMPSQAAAVTVRAGEAAALYFGPPYKPVVNIDYASTDRVQLGMSLVGSAGERCTNLLVDGTRPATKPEFTIRDPQGKVVQQGAFEYG